MKVVIDTSIIIDYLRRHHDHSKSLFIQFSKTGIIVLSTVTVAELYSGKSAQEKGAQRKFIDELIEGGEVIAPSLKTAKIVGMLRARYQLSLGDAFVAAVAIEEKLPVFTIDTKAFGNIKEINLYKSKA